MRSRVLAVGWTLASILGLWLLVVPPAHAYIDPGSGSYVFQVLIGFLLAGAVTARAYWHRIREFVSSRFQRKA
ncbi:MAG: hypothetical protein M3N51_09590 [Actinomycetota bacterium]|nr:hypothetical protein [Actinomycetota bacterium]